jgi:hypothetical protein
MSKLENMLYLYVVIIAISLLSIGTMYYLTDINTLMEPYSSIISKDSYVGIQLLIVTTIGIITIALIVKYFFDQETKERDCLNSIIDMYF